MAYSDGHGAFTVGEFLMLLTTAPVMFFGGKGGVGKTTLAAATAVALSRASARVLLVSTDPAHNLGHIWATPLSDAPTRVAERLDVVEIDPERTTAAHIEGVRTTMRRMMAERLYPEVAKHLELARQSPGMHEAAFLERLATLIDESLSDYDHIIVDTAPSGHTSRLLALPEVMAAYTDGLLARREKSEKFGSLVRGMSAADSVASTRTDPLERRNQQIRATLLARRRRFETLRGVLTDPEQCVFYIVLTAERLPVLETVEFHQELTSHGITVAGLVVNRRAPAGDGEFLQARRAIEDSALALLGEHLPDISTVHIPWLASEVGTRGALEHIADLLAG